MKKIIIFIGIVFIPGLMVATPVHPSLSQSQSTFGPTVACDDLWQIAKKLHRDNRTTVPQIMLALLKKNPKVFYHHNVNGLLEGYQLVVPSLREVQTVSKDKAAVEVGRQNARWKAIVTDLSKHPSQTYLNLRKKCCGPQHIARLDGRFHVMPHKKITLSVSRKKDEPIGKQPVQLNNTVESQVGDLQKKIAQLSAENASLRAEVKRLTVQKAILQTDRQMQLRTIQILRKQIKEEISDVNHASETKQPETIASKEDKPLGVVSKAKLSAANIPPSATEAPITPEAGQPISYEMQVKSISTSFQQPTFQVSKSNEKEGLKATTFWLWLERMILKEDNKLFLGITIGSILLLLFILIWAQIHHRRGKYDFPLDFGEQEQDLGDDSGKTVTGSPEDIESEDIMATKLDLARVYIDMGEQDRARSILENVRQNGDEAQQSEAEALLKEIVR